jgi:hypothetical protein
VILLHISLPGVPGDGHRKDFRDIARARTRSWSRISSGGVPGHTYDGLHRTSRARPCSRALPARPARRPGPHVIPWTRPAGVNSIHALLVRTGRAERRSWPLGSDDSLRPSCCPERSRLRRHPLHTNSELAAELHRQGLGV